MNRTFRSYSIIWAIMLAIFNVVSFVSVGLIWFEKYSPSFWIGYIFITLAFVGQLVCSYYAFKETKIEKFFYNLSLFKISYTGLVLTLVFGGLCMIISPLPYYVGVILCTIVLGFNAIAVVMATVAIDAVEKVDQKIKTQTFFIKSLTVDADSLMARAKSESVKAECKKVYEAVRYSDPMSNDALSSVESEITIRFAKLSDAVANDDAEKVAEIAGEVVLLVGERNKKCKVLK